MGFRIPKFGVFLLLLVAVLVWRLGSPLPFFTTSIQTIFSTSARIVNAPIEWTSTVVRTIVTLRTAQVENEKLTGQMKELHARLSFLEGVDAENGRLRSALGFSNQPFVLKTLVAADVLARQPDLWFHTVEINKGSGRGVSTGMVAITPEGVVGHVESVTPVSASIRLITDSNSSISSTCERTQELGLLSGDGTHKLLWKFIPSDSDISVGDHLRTSGASSKYPEGLRLGYVVRAESKPSALYKEVEVRPAVNFATLRSLFLISHR